MFYCFKEIERCTLITILCRIYCQSFAQLEVLNSTEWKNAMKSVRVPTKWQIDFSAVPNRKRENECEAKRNEKQTKTNVWRKATYGIFYYVWNRPMCKYIQTVHYKFETLKMCNACTRSHTTSLLLFLSCAYLLGVLLHYAFLLKRNCRRYVALWDTDNEWQWTSIMRKMDEINRNDNIGWKVIPDDVLSTI